MVQRVTRLLRQLVEAKQAGDWFLVVRLAGDIARLIGQLGEPGVMAGVMADPAVSEPDREALGAAIEEAEAEFGAEEEAEVVESEDAVEAEAPKGRRGRRRRKAEEADEVPEQVGAISPGTVAVLVQAVIELVKLFRSR